LCDELVAQRVRPGSKRYVYGVIWAVHGPRAVRRVSQAIPRRLAAGATTRSAATPALLDEA
jgi:hypothetical protein